MFRLICTALTLFLVVNVYTQQPFQKSAGMIYADIEKLGVLANVLYVAAHPDDENTRMISYLANDVKADTRYLSLTRGDGGQNLIGPEMKELLGVIRTQELLAARRIDGGSQVFSRANDFGYSKNAEETIEKWDAEKVLSDVVWAIRTFKPDIIINRFDHESSGSTHGHHTASAILSYQAFDRASDKYSFPEQLKYTDTWQPKRLFFNTSWWFYGGKDKFAKADKSDLMSIDIGSYYPLLGISNNEMAAYSRSMHKCQGMGNTPNRGSQLEYLRLLKGDMPSGKSDLLEGIDISWSRVEGGDKIKSQLDKILQQFDFNNPNKSLDDLLKLRHAIEIIKDDYWKHKKLIELEEIIVNASGLFMESNAEKNSYVAGQDIVINTEIISRLSDEVMLDRITFEGILYDTLINSVLIKNEKLIFEHHASIPTETSTTSPYWLRENGSLGMYNVDKQIDIGKPETDRALKVNYHLKIKGQPILISKKVSNKYTDPERGEVYRPLEIVEDFYLNIADQVIIFNDNTPKDIKLKVKGMVKGSYGLLSLNLPNGWSSLPNTYYIDVDQAGKEMTYTFSVTPPYDQSSITIAPTITTGSKIFKNSLFKIDYGHIPLQYVAIPSASKLVKLNIKSHDQKVLYVEGAGDDIPASLRQINYDVNVIQPEDITEELLSQYDVVILGIRAYNKSESLKYKQKLLFDFVQRGGNMIVQYTTTWRKKVDEIGPYPIQLSRDRVSVEDAPIKFLSPSHDVLNMPNKITHADFNDWVQERGLYFADEWDDRYTPVLSSNDPGESPKNGGLLIAEYGKGNFIFTGYSWFRQLPAGVPGAFRIFSNMISLGRK